MIGIVEVGPRDGLQSETAVLTPERRVELIRRLAACGLKRIETVSFADPGRVPQMAGAEEISAALTPRSFSAIGLVLNGRGMDRALDCDLDEVNVVAYASDGYALKNTGAEAVRRNSEAAALIERARATGMRVSATIAVAFGDPIEGVVEVGTVTDLASRLAAAGCHEIALGDTIGVANPVAVERLFTAVAEAVPDCTRRAHFHNTRNTGYANAVAALRSGVESLDAAVGGFGGSPFAPGAGGNVATEDLTAMLAAMGEDTGVDHDGVAEVGGWLAGLLGCERPHSMLGRVPPWPPTRGGSTPPR